MNQTKRQLDGSHPSDDIIHPVRFVCPISQELMSEPITFTLDGHDYTFDRVTIEAWMTTPNGDMNPLTMLPGLHEAKRVKNKALLQEIKDYKKSIGLDPDTKTDEPEIEPFSDFQQIQDDEDVARRLHNEINGIQPQNLFQRHLFHRFVRSIRPEVLDIYNQSVMEEIMNNSESRLLYIMPPGIYIRPNTFNN